MPVAELPGVSMWYDERGQGDPCVLLHPGGAGIDSRALGATLDGLARVFRAYTPEQRAHGRTPDADGPLSYDLMAGATIAFSAPSCCPSNTRAGPTWGISAAV